MEGVYLLCSIASAAILTSVKSLFLAFQSLPLLFSRPSAAAPTAVYEGRVHHARLRPVSHSFDYPVRYALIDLDLSPQPAHLSAARARQVAATDGPVFLLTIPASVGYEQNPLSVYYCYEMAGEGKEAGASPSLKKCIAEVTNTPWGERVSFVFDPRSDVVAKPLHVSPLMDMLGNWSIRADAPGEVLFIKISVQHPTLGNYFTATLSAKRVYLSSSSHCLAIYFWLMPHQVAIWIYWQVQRRVVWLLIAWSNHTLAPELTNPHKPTCPAGHSPLPRGPIKSRRMELAQKLANSTHFPLLPLHPHSRSPLSHLHPLHSTPPPLPRYRRCSAIIHSTIPSHPPLHHRVPSVAPPSPPLITPSPPHRLFKPYHCPPLKWSLRSSESLELTLSDQPLFGLEILCSNSDRIQPPLCSYTLNW